MKDEVVLGADDPAALPPPARCTHYEYGGDIGWLAIPSNAEYGLVMQVFDQMMARMAEVAYRDHASVIRPDTFHECFTAHDIIVYMMQIERMPGVETSDG